MSKRNEINRRNALRSTGPRTQAGRAVSSMNAVRHGGYSAAVAILGEDPEGFDALATELINSLQPIGPLEHRIVSRLASLWWRLERAVRAEREGLKTTLELARHALGRSRLLTFDPFEEVLPVPAPDYTEPVYTAFTWGFAADGIERLQRYEGQLERSFFRVQHELESIQARRRGQAPELPVAANVIPPGGGE